MTRYLDDPLAGGEGTEEIEGYRAGVDRVMIYIQSINAYRKLEDEIEWAIKKGII